MERSVASFWVVRFSSRFWPVDLGDGPLLRILATNAQRTSRSMSLSTQELKKVWIPKGKKTQPSTAVKVGDCVTLYYVENDEDGNKSVNAYDAVVTKVNTKTFNAICAGEDAQVPITKYPNGVWHFPGDGPVVDDVEFENFKLLNSGPVSDEPQKSSWSQILRQETNTWKTFRWT